MIPLAHENARAARPGHFLGISSNRASDRDYSALSCDTFAVFGSMLGGTIWAAAER